MSQINLEIPEKLLFLINKKIRYKVAFGGRGSSKSWSFARALLYLAMFSKIRILCTRQLQTSISNSVHKLLSDSISDMGLSKYFEITRETIRCYNGSEFFFKGIQNNINEIKSIEGIDICWVEEAQSVSQDSWDVLIPTIRKEGSEIWVSFNPDREEDATYKLFVTNKRDNCKSILVNFSDNPWFPNTLREEMEYCKRTDFGKYEHVWLGKTVLNTDSQVFNGKFDIKDFESPEDARFFYGADWGFACLKGDTLVSTKKGDVPLKDINVGDEVLTRKGYKKVLFTKNKGYKKVYELDFGYGSSIIATGDHKIFTYNGWKRVDELERNEELCVIKSSLMVKLIKGIRKVSTQITSTIKTEKKTGYITETCGNIIKAIFQKAMLYTISTVIHSITILKTLLVLLLMSIQRYTITIILAQYQKKDCVKLEKRTDIQKKIGRKGKKSQLKQFNIKEEYVKSVKNLSKLLMFTKSSVVRIVEKSLIQGIAKKNMFVKSAVKHLLQQLMGAERHVRKSVPINLVELIDKEEVFDITVEDCPEYFANGVLVHNCDPTVLTRSYILDRSLYIDYEAFGVGVELDEIPQLFDSVPDSRKWKILADCARPETVSHIRNKGFIIESCPKWKGSVEDGIEYLRSFEKIYIHPRCKHTYNEFKFYSYKQDRNTNEVLPILLDKDNHAIDSLRYALNSYIQQDVSILQVL